MTPNQQVAGCTATDDLRAVLDEATERATRKCVAQIEWLNDQLSPLFEQQVGRVKTLEAALRAQYEARPPIDKALACATCNGDGYMDDLLPCDDCKGSRISPAFAPPTKEQEHEPLDS